MQVPVKSSRARAGGIRPWMGMLLTVPLAVGACQDAPIAGVDGLDSPRMDVSATASSGVTEAPDLLSVGNFRPGPTDDDGNPQTLVDFTFDQVAYVNGGDHSNFHLVPLDGGDAVDARALRPEADEEGDNVVTVLFSGTLSATNYARGFVDTGIVNSNCCNVGPDNPGNINQAAAISNEGRTENPDLVSVTRDGDQVLYEFDEPLTDDDVVQNTSGLRVYFPETDAADRIREAGALAVKRKSPTVLRAYFGDDLPEGYTLADAVGGFVTQGSVQAAQGSRGANDGKNAFDELAPMGDTGAQVCPKYAPLDTKFVNAGPTEAPDLVRVGNFRRGPFTSQFEPTTCVDFSFDQVAYLNGGDRSNFHLVPLNGGDALDGSTNGTPESDEAGDNIVTVIFPGDLSPEDFARGYVDSGVVNSDCCNVSADNPANVNQSEDISPNTQTENPDLVRVSRERNTFLFEFDEALTDDDVVQNNSGLQIYFATATQQATIPSAGASRVERVNSTTLRAYYEGVIPEGYTLDDVVGAFVDQGSVQAAVGSHGGNDGKNAFDEVVVFGNAFPSVTPVCNGYLATLIGSGDIKGSSGRDVIVGSAGADKINGKGGDDIICGVGGDDLLKGESGNDALFGDDGDDELRGQAGMDLLYGGYGADLLKGDRGDDFLFGGAGNDDLRGQEDADFFDGGPGTDTSDYDSSEDREQIRVP